jgi:hypothetical protein
MSELLDYLVITFKFIDSHVVLVMLNDEYSLILIDVSVKI